jgi:diguanylate cyclase (GGDEF)-like protein
MTPPLHVLWVGGAAPDLPATEYGPFDLHACPSLDEAAQALRDATHDALLLWLAPGMAQALGDWQALSHAVLDSAVVVVAPDLWPDLATALTRRGVQDLLPEQSADADTLARVLRLAVERKRLERAARKAYATDLSTGLPNHAQLLEHMTHLLALREREPAPMALLVLRIEGLSTTERALGHEAANVLRRKLAVRVRAGLRASDVVASIGNDAFAVLLAWIDAPDDALRVAGKLVLALREREPAPMALLVLRIEGLSTTERALGSEAANVLRRKLAVRVRAGLRASDVVASIGNDAFAVLLAWIDAPDDARRVAGKLALALQQPVRVAGQDQAVAVAVGVSQYPEHGRLAEDLLRRAIGQATGGAPLGRAGFANRVERGGTSAANDEE